MNYFMIKHEGGNTGKSKCYGLLVIRNESFFV